MNTAPIEQHHVDLASCSSEPIRIPGSIQPRGFLIALRASDPIIVQVSDNIGSCTGKGPDDVLGKPIADLLGAENGAWLLAAIRNAQIEARSAYLGALALANGRFFDVLAHASDDLVIVEFETVPRKAAADFSLLYPLLSSFLGNLADARSIEAMSELAAGEIKRVTGYGRVLVYRFDEDQHGHVLAEARDEEYRSYLHQRFPASDVPPQARALYIANRIRLISDANYAPSFLVPADNPLTGKPTDLSFASLRSVSPVHIRYMKNMGTLASMSISLVVKGRLWGLISCHNAEPMSVQVEARAACEQLGQILALKIESHEDSGQYSYRLELRRMLVSILSSMSQGSDFVDSMTAVSPELLRFANASGAAILLEGRLVRYGDAPSEAQVRDLVQWLSVNGNGDVFHTNALSTRYPGGATIKSNASGILALSISQIHRHYIIWFRPEVVQTIDWAGNPHLKEAQTGSANQLTPRMSFDIWQETVLGTSLPWNKSEVDIALEFRAAMLGIVLERAEQMAELAEELGRANKELESFSYSVSHDLRAPLRHIVGFTDLLLEFEDKQLSARGTRFLRNIKDSARFAGKLVDDLLSFSQMGRAALRVTTIDMNELVRASVGKLSQELGERRIHWEIGPLPTIEGDPAFLQLALYNLLSNAAKYSKNQEQAVISVSAEQHESDHIFHVRDNGVGFNMEYVHKLFGVFQRLHRMEEFEGTGIGLANVRRIVERHGGRAWANSVPGEGAVFSFSIPKQLSLMDGDKHVKTNTSR